VKIPDPQFEGQTKMKLGNSEVKGVVETILNEGLSRWLEENPNYAKLIIEKARDAARAREAAKKAKELTRKMEFLNQQLFLVSLRIVLKKTLLMPNFL